MWANIWNIAARNVTNPSTCRAACHVLNVLLKLRLVKYSSVTETFDSMLVSANLNGPTLLAESPVSLFITVIHETARENPSKISQLSERITDWLFSKWTPSKLLKRALYKFGSDSASFEEFRVTPREILEAFVHGISVLQVLTSLRATSGITVLIIPRLFRRENIFITQHIPDRLVRHSSTLKCMLRPTTFFQLCHFFCPWNSRTSYDALAQLSVISTLSAFVERR
jgi:hypothetical protein